MKKNKTTENTLSVTEFINSVTDSGKRNDSYRLIEIMHQTTGFEPKMWGTAIVGFGSYHYKYESGREGDAPLVGFSPRSNALSLYMALDADTREELLSKFGKHKTGKSCIYVKKLEDVDQNILKEMVIKSVDYLTVKYSKS